MKVQSRCALLVIDMQLCGFDGEVTPPVQNGRQLLDKVSELIAISRLKQIPVIYVQTCALSGQPYARDVHGWEIHPLIPPEPDDLVVFKRNSSGFEGTDLQQRLIELGVEAVITCGIWSEFCVANTSLSALERGFDVYVAADAHGTVSSSEAEAARVVAVQNNYLRQHRAHVSEVHELQEMLSG